MQASASRTGRAEGGGRAELDLLVVKGRRRLGFEFKHTNAPGFTKFAWPSDLLVRKSITKLSRCLKLTAVPARLKP